MKDKATMTVPFKRIPSRTVNLLMRNFEDHKFCESLVYSDLDKRRIEVDKSPKALPADVGLFEVRPHADRLSVELVGLLQPRLVGPDQIGQVYVNVEMVRGHARRILLPGNHLVSDQQRPI